MPPSVTAAIVRKGWNACALAMCFTLRLANEEKALAADRSKNCFLRGERYEMPRMLQGVNL